jgi:altronate hydrolase
MQVLERTMAGYATHPNFAGVLAIGLGCEANQLKVVDGAQRFARGQHACKPSTSKTAAAPA